MDYAWARCLYFVDVDLINYGDSEVLFSYFAHTFNLYRVPFSLMYATRIEN